MKVRLSLLAIFTRSSNRREAAARMNVGSLVHA